MTRVLHSEWTKLRTEAVALWLLFGAFALTVALSAGAAASVSCDGPDCSDDLTKLSLVGIMLGQAVIAILAVLAMGNEYGTGMIRLTFAATPRRMAVLAAKAVVLTGVVLVAGAAAVLGSIMAGRFILPGNGFDAAHGFTTLSLADGPTLRAAAGSVLYLVLIALLSLGVATAVRDSATAVGVVLGVLYLFPIITQVVGDPDWEKRLQQISPMNAGLAIQSTRGIENLPIGPWEGLGVLTVWAAAALLAGALALRWRDA